MLLDSREYITLICLDNINGWGDRIPSGNNYFICSGNNI
jgi:hypothetical protein